jgi:hypothetical protein
MHRADANYGARVAKDTVWALYNRVMLLWHGCLRLRMDGALPHADKAQFAMAAWLELDAIEAALDGHTCGVERAYLFQGREVVFNTRMAISYEYQKFIPDVMSNFNGFFHRAKAEAWLTRQRALAAGMVRNFGDLTGLRSNMLTYRPFFSLWLMAQVSRCLMLWSVDSSLMLALEVAEAWLPPLEYLLAVWPSAGARLSYLPSPVRADMARSSDARQVRHPPRAPHIGVRRRRLPAPAALHARARHSRARLVKRAQPTFFFLHPIWGPPFLLCSLREVNYCITAFVIHTRIHFMAYSTGRIVAAVQQKREEEARAQEKLRSMRVWVQGYKWIKQGSGYRCAGGAHFIHENALR